MAPRIKEAESAGLAAVSSRKMETAQDFAEKHAIPAAFDSWQQMIESGQVDAVYIATPTSVKEEISLAAVRHGIHILVEKPFADLASLKRMTAACREKGVGFMDGTHFPTFRESKNSRGHAGNGRQAMVGRFGVPVQFAKYRTIRLIFPAWNPTGPSATGLVQHAGRGGIPAG